MSTFFATSEAVLSAVRNAERDGVNYQVERSTPGQTWYVAHQSRRTSRYLVALNPFTEDPAFPLQCACPAFKKGGYCKHCAMVEDYEATLTAEEHFETGADEWADLEARRAERPVGMAATVTRESHPDPLGVAGRACAFAEWREGCQCERCQKRTL